MRTLGPTHLEANRARAPGVSRFVVMVALGGCVDACGGDDAGSRPPSVPLRTIAADVGELEIQAAGSDRFTTCPPPGELGQPWMPAPTPWTPAPATARGPLPPGESVIDRTAERTPTELAIEASRRDLRSCYRHGLVRHPNAEGRVALVLRLAPDGRVAKVETYAACELSPESLACMEDVVQRLRFAPSLAGSAITIPATFTSRDGMRGTSRATSADAYTASAYLALEAARPALHTCEQQARGDREPVTARGTYALVLAVDGRVLRVDVEEQSGDRALVACASRALETLRFDRPPASSGVIMTRLNFNPRQGSR